MMTLFDEDDGGAGSVLASLAEAVAEALVPAEDWAELPDGARSGDVIATDRGRLTLRAVEREWDRTTLYFRETPACLVRQHEGRWSWLGRECLRWLEVFHA